MRTRVLCLLLLSGLVAVTLSEETTAGEAEVAVTQAAAVQVLGGGSDVPETVAVVEVVTQGQTAAQDGATAPPATAAPALGSVVTNAGPDHGADATSEANKIVDDGTAGTVAMDTQEAGTVQSEGGTAAAVTSAVDLDPGTAAGTVATPEAAEGAASTAGAPPAVPEKTEGADEVTTQAAPQAEEVTTQAAPQVVTYSYPADDPCNNYETLNEDKRHYTHKMVEGEVLSDEDLSDGWHAFTYMGEPAIITPICVKEKYCSTHMPYHLSNDTLPDIGNTISSSICGPGTVAGETSCCLMERPLLIRRCQTSLYIFKLLATTVKLGRASICVQLPDEDMPPMYHAIPKEVVVTTPAPKPTLPSIHYTNLSSLDGVVTVELAEYTQEKKDTDYLFSTFDPVFKQLLAQQLNNMTDDATPTTAAPPVDQEKTGGAEAEKVPSPTVKPTRIPNVDSDAGFKGPEDMKRRRRETQRHMYTPDDVKYVGPTPRETGGDGLQVACYVEDPETGVVPAERVKRALEELDDSNKMNVEMGMPVRDVYVGLPAELLPAQRLDDSDVWARHRDLLIALIVISSICLLVIILGVCCLKCRSNKGSWDREDEKLAMEAGQSKKRPIVHENPLPDSEIMKDEGPMVERENPAMTSNGGGQHISKKDDDNGWIVPIDELSKAEKEKPEVEDTKL